MLYVGYIRPSYLVLLGLAAASLLFYAAYVSQSPFVVRLPSPPSARAMHAPSSSPSSVLSRPCCNESSVSSDVLDSTLNHTEVPDEKSTGNRSTSITRLTTSHPIVLVPHQPANTTLSVADAMSMGVLAQSIYESGHLEPVSPMICPDLGDSLQLLIMIASAPAHTEARMAVRQTWGHYQTRRDVSIAFMLGITSNATLQQLISSEEYMYGDIIRGKFIDTYDNLTLKTISILEWVDNYCPNVAFVLKTDDDMFINVSKLLNLISKRSRNDRIIYGRLAKKWKPIRNKKSKYYISPQQYKPAIFPDFTTGPAYLIPSCVVHDLYLAALNHTYFKLEDVFVTGIVAHFINVKRVHVNEFLNKRISFNPCNVQKGVSIHMVKYSEQFDLWKKLLDGRSKCK